MFRIGRCLGFTRRSTADGRAVAEITGGFREISPEDPVKYDFALTRFGIQNLKDCSLLNGCSPQAAEKEQMKQTLLIVMLCVSSSILFGVLHNQASARVSLEYFTIGHRPLISSISPTLMGIAGEFIQPGGWV